MACFAQVMLVEKEKNSTVEISERIYLNLDNVTFMRPRKDGRTWVRCGERALLIEETIADILKQAETRVSETLPIAAEID